MNIKNHSKITKLTQISSYISNHERSINNAITFLMKIASNNHLPDLI